jgi:hypothetical protein
MGAYIVGLPLAGGLVGGAAWATGGLGGVGDGWPGEVNTYGDRPYGHLALSYSEARRFS